MNLLPIIRRMFPAVALLALPLIGNFNAYAQDATPPAERKPVVEEQRIIVERGKDDDNHTSFAFSTGSDGNMIFSGIADGGTYNFVSSEMSFDMRTVKGAPYTGEAVTETVQTLADGNRIVRRTTANVARDGEGRTRREQTITLIGNFAARSAKEPARTIFISDPVAGVNYILNEKDRTVRKMPNFNFDLNMPNTLEKYKLNVNIAPFNNLNFGKDKIVIVKETKDGVTTTKEYRGKEADEYLARVNENTKSNIKGKVILPPQPPRTPNRANTESLGKQIIEGVEAEGTRTTTTIPAGEIGNERPIVITSERWYSPELQTVIMTRRNDPRSGETTYRLTNINRSEPARSLFEVPSDYTIKGSYVNLFGNRKAREEK